MVIHRIRRIACLKCIDRGRRGGLGESSDDRLGRRQSSARPCEGFVDGQPHKASRWADDSANLEDSIVGSPPLHGLLLLSTPALIAALLVCLVLSFTAVAGEEPGSGTDQATKADPASADPAAALDKQNKPDPKAIRLDKEKKTIEVDGKICLDEGQLELFACAEGGKEYESLVAIRGEAWQLHLSLLLLGLKPGGGPEYQGDPAIPFGDPVIIEVQWEENGKTIRKRAEDLMFDTKKNTSMEHIEWVFIGSKFAKDDQGNDYYMANRDKSIVTVFHDPLSVIDNPLASGGDDTVYIVNKKTAPPKGTPVVLIITPGTKKAEKPAPELKDKR